MTGSAAFAQSSSFNKGDNLLHIGIGVGSPFFGSGYSTSLPVNPSVSFEHGLSEAISVGGQLSYASYKYSYNLGSLYGGNYTFKESATYAGIRGSYHLNEALGLDKPWDCYGGASLGYVIVSASDNMGYSAAAGSALGFGLYAGGKYYFSSRTGVYAEAGYQSLSYLNIGITFKL